ncbi:Protein SYM1 [Monoraphidium neglectum]|uniref:Protein SYM1 n=1 Tax=Monoraphidium neglectum TaxID=145388 RepID=A0A0D2LWB4_9CHLO|nr:Protein SYM1 [Monoraphidium neglectum]KIY95774.1 Protein SYM1 [Monoraphidium neglectum]|eukprot:XP_013894794.1 Protein SYM1 [Monoraphidium neglectum]
MLGDIIAQQVGHHPGAGFDVLRVARLGLYGLCLDGPLGSAWYDWLEGAVFPNSPTEAKAVAAKTLLDQVVYASIGTGLFFAVITALEGHPELAPSVVAAKFWPTLAANWAIWPAAHIVNFRFVPSQFRIAYNNVVAIGWLALLSAITHSHGPSLINAALSHLHMGNTH